MTPKTARVVFVLSIIMLLLASVSLASFLFVDTSLRSHPPFGGVAALTAPARGTVPSHRGYSSPFSFELAPRPDPAWMAPLPDNASLTTLSIPGTHDTMTYNVADIFFHCQNVALAAQLRAGIRYLDIRLRLRKRELAVFHSNAYTGFTFVDVLRTVFEFLEENPSETVVIRAKKEGSAIDGDESVTFKEAWNATAAGMGEQWEKHVLRMEEEAWPTLGALRGRTLMLYQFDPEGDTAIGVPWDDYKMVLQDYYNLPTKYALAMKWVLIQDSLEKVSGFMPLKDDSFTLTSTSNTTGSDGDGLLYVSHVSATTALLPIAVAAGPLGDFLPGMNNVLGEYLEDPMMAKDDDGSLRRTGVVIMDFPGQRLVDAIIQRNDRLVG